MLWLRGNDIWLKLGLDKLQKLAFFATCCYFLSNIGLHSLSDHGQQMIIRQSAAQARKWNSVGVMLAPAGTQP